MGFGVWGLGLKMDVADFGVIVQGSGCKAWSLGLRV